MILWHARAAWSDPRPGGEFRKDITDRNVARGKFIEVDPPHRVVFSWGWEGSAELPLQTHGLAGSRGCGGRDVSSSIDLSSRSNRLEPRPR